MADESLMHNLSQHAETSCQTESDADMSDRKHTSGRTFVCDAHQVTGYENDPDLESGGRHYHSKLIPQATNKQADADSNA